MIPKDKFGMTSLVLLTTPFERDKLSSQVMTFVPGIDDGFARLIAFEERRPGSISLASEHVVNHLIVSGRNRFLQGARVSIAAAVDMIESGSPRPLERLDPNGSRND